MTGPEVSRPKRYCFVFTGAADFHDERLAALAWSVPAIGDSLRRGADLLEGLGRPTAADGIRRAVAGRRTDFRELDGIWGLRLFLDLGFSRHLQESGVTPGAVIGTCVGELAAAVLAELLTEDEALHIALLQADALVTGADGAMVAAVADRGQYLRVLAETGLRPAAENSDRHFALTGSHQAVRQAQSMFEQSGDVCRLLDVEVAGHRSIEPPHWAELRELAEVLPERRPTIPVVSSVTGEPLTSGVPKGHWVRHLQQPILFAAAARRLIDEIPDYSWHFVQFGPGRSVSRFLEALPDVEAACTATQPLATGTVEEQLEALRRAVAELAPMLSVRGDTEGTEVVRGAL
ncbi:acyltransferase domain-containing protein [Streptomyces cyaneofuscatus]|uniref:acyltransferase domain-containing protein n=1 Tax=Streptomyces cyaneofuscatus TaxID=66883 RepID=UPI0004CAF86A|nr:acyltransferase domain-containing protein [Streptomyces cyaneofuscatus]